MPINGIRDSAGTLARSGWFALVAALCLTATSAGQSVCFGTPARGRLEKACALPANGANFVAYSAEGVRLGRTYVHCTVAEIVTAAYAALEEPRSEARFVYGETGKAKGGDFSPHKTHQNGLSVDFFVPVRDASSRVARVRTEAGNRWGYDLEFDSKGSSGGLTIDFEVMAAHLLALAEAAEKRGVGIRRVYFDVALQRHLQKTSSWPRLRDRIPFSTQEGWWRHDEHYHVDFEIPCLPLEAK